MEVWIDPISEQEVGFFIAPDILNYGKIEQVRKEVILSEVPAV